MHWGLKSCLARGIAALFSVSAWAMTLSDQLLSSNHYVSQGALGAIRAEDALSWTQNPALLASLAPQHTHLSSGTYFVRPQLNPKPAEKSALGTQVLGLAAPSAWGTFGLALAMPLGQNVWVDTGARESSALFGLSRMSAFSVGFGWGMGFRDGWSAGLHIPVLFRSNTTTDIYLVNDHPWARARTGVKPYLGWQVGVKKEWESSGWRVALAYREEQASKIEFGVKGEVDFTNLSLPLDAAGSSEILFEPRRLDVQIQKHFAYRWQAGFFARWSNWRSAPPLGLVINSKVPQMSTEASQVSWQDQWELSTALAYSMEWWTPVVSYRYRARAVLASNDYWDYNEHVLALGAHVGFLEDRLRLVAALRLHNLVGNGKLYSMLAGADWAL